MTEAEQNLDHWRKQYANDLARGRNPLDFGMKWMAWQIELWEASVRDQDNED